MANQLVNLSSILRSSGFGQISSDAQKKLIEWDNKLQQSLSLQGELLAAVNRLAANTTVEGRSGTLQSGLANLDQTGVLQDAGVGFTVDSVPDGISRLAVNPTQRTGATRAAAALDSDNRLVSSFNENPLNVTVVPTSASQMSNDGTTTVITVAAGTYQFGPGTVSYNSGSVDPGSFGKKYIYFNDPTYSGGAVTFQFSTTPVNTANGDGIIYVGSITTVNASSSAGGGYGGGGGGTGGRGFGL